MSNYWGNLSKEFVRSAVRQVGRDGGKVISNKIYKGKHGTPIYYSGDGSGMSSSTVDISEINMDEQPRVKGGGVVPVLKGIFFQIIPLIGSLVVLVQSLNYLLKKKVAVYATVPNRVADKRYKVGYRIDGYSLVKTGAKRMLQEDERKRMRNRGISYLISWLIIFPFGLSMYALTSNNTSSTKQPEKYAHVISDNVNVRQDANTTSNVISTLQVGDSLKILSRDGSLETINGKTENWVQVEVDNKQGWVWGGLITYSK